MFETVEQIGWERAFQEYRNIPTAQSGLSGRWPQWEQLPALSALGAWGSGALPQESMGELKRDPSFTRKNLIKTSLTSVPEREPKELLTIPTL